MDISINFQMLISMIFLLALSYYFSGDKFTEACIRASNSGVTKLQNSDQIVYIFCFKNKLSFIGACF